jgi:hypothetical protein
MKKGKFKESNNRKANNRFKKNEYESSSAFSKKNEEPKNTFSLASLDKIREQNENPNLIYLDKKQKEEESRRLENKSDSDSDSDLSSKGSKSGSKSGSDNYNENDDSSNEEKMAKEENIKQKTFDIKLFMVVNGLYYIILFNFLFFHLIFI